MRSIATLSISFGLVSIPVKVYLATESTAAIRFKLMARGGVPVRQRYVADAGEMAEAAAQADAEPAAEAVVEAEAEAAGDDPLPPPRPLPAAERVQPLPSAARALSPSFDDSGHEQVVPRSQMVKGYEFDKGRYVLFTPDELAALAAQSRQTIDIVAFVPQASIDPIWFDKAYFLAPAGRGGRPYSLLRRALEVTGHSALAKWAWRAKEYVVQIRPFESGLVLQQLFYADEVRDIGRLDIEPIEVGAAELELATRLIAQASEPAYDPARFVDEEKQRLLEAVERKVRGQRIVAPRAPRSAPGTGAEVVDLLEALKASLAPAKERKPPRRAAAGGSATRPRARKA